MRHLAAALCLLSAPALAQSNPSFITGQIPTAAQWNSYFGKKADVTGGTINNGTLNSVTINGSLGGSPTVGGVWTASNATLSGFTITGGSLGGSITGTGATITGGTFSGITLSGTIPGSPTASGTWTFQNNNTVGSSFACPININAGASVDVITSNGLNCQLGFTSKGTGVILLQAPTPAASSGYIKANGTLSLRQATAMTSGTAIGFGGLSPAAIWEDINWTGTQNTGGSAVNFFRLNDAVVSSTSPGLAGMILDREYNTGADGNRVLLQLDDNHNAASLTGNGAYTTLQVFVSLTAGEGGSGPNTYKGEFWAENLDVGCKTGCDYIERLKDTEMDMRAYAGTHVNAKLIANLKWAQFDAVHGASDDIGLVFDAATDIAEGTGKGQTLIALGKYNGDFPLDPTLTTTSAIMQVRPDILSNLSQAWKPYAAYGIDLSFMNFAQKAWRSPGFQVDGGGQLNLGPATLTYAANTATLDVPNVVETSAVVVATGSNAYHVGDVLKDTIGGLWSVATITPGVQTVSLLHAGYASVCPVSPTATTGGSGDGNVTLTISCSVATKGLVLAGASTALGFYGATAIVKATPAGACAGNTGCQALRDALGNLGLINTGSITN